MIQKKRILGLICMIVLLVILTFTGCSSKSSKVLDNNGETIGTLTNIKKQEYASYLDIVEREAVTILMRNEQYTESAAKEAIKNNDYTIYTNLDVSIYDSMKKTYETYNKENLSFGCAVTDLNGNLIAVYSAGNDEENFAMKNTSPYSTIKPLSVYLPALESGETYWSKTYVDSPIKKIEYDNGDKENWPSNASGTYSNQKTTVEEALKLSLNTVAAKCLSDYGVENSIQYLKEHFGIELGYELEKLETHGEDEILGNVAFGYLDEGFSPVDMAGYYQVFANGGLYQSPSTIIKICSEGGEVVYQSETEAKSVITAEAAYVVNHLLQGVTDTGGTGVDAAVSGLKIGGKTGTGEEGNWFVGFTPEYSCAVWHGSELIGNYASFMFSEIVNSWTHDTTKDYPQSPTVKEALFCQSSGLLLTDKCETLGRGYYLSVKCPSPCKKH